MPSINSVFIKVVHVYTFCALIIGGATCAYFLSISIGNWRIRTGCEPKQNCNWAFFMNFAALGFCIILFLYAVVEIISLFQVHQAHILNISYIKPIIYLISGICLIGICGDLGIAAGAFMLAAGVIWLAIIIFMSQKGIK